MLTEPPDEGCLPPPPPFPPLHPHPPPALFTLFLPPLNPKLPLLLLLSRTLIIALLALHLVLSTCLVLLTWMILRVSWRLLVP